VVEPAVLAELNHNPRAFVIVRLDDAPLRGATGAAPRRELVRAMQDAVLAAIAGRGGFTPVHRYRNVAAMTGYADPAGLAALAALPSVIAVGGDAPGRAAFLDDSVPFIGAAAVHESGYDGGGITVAVLDTGIDTNHPDLIEGVAPGAWHFLDQGANQGPGAEDDNGHGTNVAGIITSDGVVAPPGVAPGAAILAIKVLSASGAGWLSDWAAGVDHVVSHHGEYPRLAAINMSLVSFALYGQCPCDNASVSNQLLQAALDAARDQGIATFASSGNLGSCTTMASPACLSAAAAVAAVYDQDLGQEPNNGTYQSQFGSSFAACADATTGADRITCFSNRSPCNLLAAPGRQITAPGIGGGVSTFTGTSQAAPHCAGVAALMCDKDASGLLTPEGILKIMIDTAAATLDPCATAPNPARVDAQRAVEAVPQLQGDVNGDGAVDVLDLVEVIVNWGACPAGACRADIDGDSVVNVIDLILVILNWS
jgi:subtilisin family serine protease